MPWAAGLLGTASVLLEFVAYRLNAAVYGWGYARIVAVLAPVLGGVLAAWFASRPASRSASTANGDASVGRAAYAASFAAAAAGFTTIALTWGSQRFAKLDGSLAALVVPALAWALLCAGIATAIAGIVRAEPSRTGRHLFAFGGGGAVGALLVPAALAVGCPRSLLWSGFALAAVSVLCARATRVRLRWSVLATVPLALLSLSLGDIRNPWLKLRTDVARKGRVGATVWTTDGLVQVDQGKAGIVNYTVDRGGLKPLSLEEKGKRRQAFELSDIAYFLNGTAGAALVVGSGGGRELREALDAGHVRVDAVESTSSMARLVATDFARESGNLFNQSERLTLRFGEPETALARLRDSYDRIVVLGEPTLEPVSSRLIVGAARPFTVEALRAYVARLSTPRGVLVVRVAKSQLSELLASMSAATTPETVAERAVVCAERNADGAAALLLMAGAPSGPELQNVEKSCKRKGLTVEFPSAEAHNGDRDREGKQKAHEAKLAALASGHVVDRNRPFFEARRPFFALRGVARESLRALAAKELAKAKPKDDREALLAQGPQLSALGVATSACAFSMLLLLVGLLLPVSSTTNSDFPVSLRAAAPFIGISTGLVIVALDDAIVGCLGGTDWAWSVVIPTATVAFGAGRAFADTMGEGALRRCVAWASLAAMLAAALLVVLGSRAIGASAWPLSARLGTAFGVLLFVGGAFGVHMALIVRLAARTSDAAVGWTLGVTGAAVAAGAALAQWVALYAGVTRLPWCAAVTMGVGALLATCGGDQRFSSFLRQGSPKPAPQGASAAP